MNKEIPPEIRAVYPFESRWTDIGGGVSDGRGLMAVPALGTDTAIIGTRLLPTQECPMHENVKQCLLSASELDTMH